MKKLLSAILLASAAFVSCEQTATQADVAWPEVKPESKPGTRWWWHGSAVDKENLTGRMEEMQQVGIGAVEVTPIYGVRGHESRHIEYLSDKWMEMFAHVQNEGKRLGILVDMNGGTGWPFGGPNIPVEYAATKEMMQNYTLAGGQRLKEKIVYKAPEPKKGPGMTARKAPAADPKAAAPYSKLSIVMAYSDKGEKLDITSFVKEDGTLEWTAPVEGGNWNIVALLLGKTGMMVKRSAPGGEGFVMDHLSKEALAHYLERFDSAFKKAGIPYPHSFFNDSYEVYGADWSPGFFQEFEARRGYKLQDYLPELQRIGVPEVCSRVISDYRETLSDMLLDNFTISWTDWAHKNGSTTRNQAHGSPGNLIDLYAAMDIPECESYGRTMFDIPGIRVDQGMKQNESDATVLKYASSAAHVTGKPFTSSETFTWLTEHFRASLSQMKPELDLLYLSGVNHVYFHGSAYSPDDAKWPGWLFYASTNLNKNNSIWRDMPAMNQYITRTQSFLQSGTPDNDFLVYLPIYDIWHDMPGLFLLFYIGDLKEMLPSFAHTVTSIRSSGYDLDYISDAFIAKTSVENGLLKTPGATYKAIIVPAGKVIPVGTIKNLVRLAENGATVIFTESLPGEVPGIKDMNERKGQLEEVIASLPASSRDFSKASVASFGKGKIVTAPSIEEALQAAAYPAEAIVETGASYIRRKHDHGHIYFISMLSNHNIDGWVALGTDAASAMIYDPMTGQSGAAQIRQKNGKAEVYLQMKPDQSLVVKTFTNKKLKQEAFPVYATGDAVALEGDWKFKFTDGMPAIDGEWTMPGDPVSWTQIDADSALVYMGTGRYTLEFDLPAVPADQWRLDLRSVSESAHVYVNGKDAGRVWAVPFEMNIGELLQLGKNKIEVDVTNLPLNRMRDYDARKVDWRIFYNINIATMLSEPITIDMWDVMPSGLTETVKLVPLSLKKAE